MTWLNRRIWLLLNIFLAAAALRLAGDTSFFPGNTLHDNGNWISSKVDLEKTPQGAITYVLTENALGPVEVRIPIKGRQRVGFRGSSGPVFVDDVIIRGANNERVIHEQFNPKMRQHSILFLFIGILSSPGTTTGMIPRPWKRTCGPWWK